MKETDVEIQRTSETKETKLKQERSTEEDTSPFLFLERKWGSGQNQCNRRYPSKWKGKDKGWIPL